MPNTRQLPDLVRDNKLEAHIKGNSTRHVLYRSGFSARDRHVRTEELWVREAPLGQGAHSTVYRERCDDGEVNKLRAVKEMKKRVISGEDLDYMRELEAIFKFSHPKDQDSVFISMEYLKFGDLQKNLDQALPEVEARQIVSQILDGLGYMHENGFVHRDLKPGNIMVVVKGPDWFVKIADFGISKRRYEDMSTLMTMYRGTLGFAAPEVIGFQSGSDSTKASKVNFFTVDMWSLGALAFKLLTNAAAFLNFIELSKYIEGRMNFPEPKLELHNVSKQGRDFVARLMSITPEARLSVNQAKNHPWASTFLAPIITPLEPSSPEIGTNEKIVDTETGVSVASALWSSDVTASTASKRATKNIRSKLPSSNHTPIIDAEDSTGPGTDSSDSEEFVGAHAGSERRRSTDGYGQRRFEEDPNPYSAISEQRRPIVYGQRRVEEDPNPYSTISEQRRPIEYGQSRVEVPNNYEVVNYGNSIASRGAVQRNNRYTGAYDQDEFRGHDGSSGAAKRVMDFFRRRGKVRTREG